jgi:hypothetical protein
MKLVLVRVNQPKNIWNEFFLNDPSPISLHPKYQLSSNNVDVENLENPLEKLELMMGQFIKDMN